MKYLLLLASFLGVANALTQAAANDKIVSLPGVPSTPSFDMYSGYLDIQDESNPSSYRHVFYWHTESQNDPTNDPVIFWTNGGPGCSGLIGFFEEFGPYHPNPDGQTLYENPYSWNTVANLVFIESPAGVGFSYADNEDDYTVGDSRTARDNLQVILAFLEKFPNYQTNKNGIYIASESYGGHYGPTWTLEILKSNAAGINAHINFQGFLIGNPYTNPNENIIGSLATFYGHQMIPASLWKSIEDNCFPTQSSQCNKWINQANRYVGDIDPYSLDTNVCVPSSEQRRRLLTRLNRIADNGRRGRGKLRTRAAMAANATIPPYDPCVANYETTYLNRPEVISAIHANLVPTDSWDSCSFVVDYNYTDMDVPMEPLYNEILSYGTDNKYVVFSGDDDSVCGGLGTQSWIFNISLKIVNDWAPWEYNNQVAGYVTKLEGLSYVTVHTAGHEVAMFQPARALEFLKRFLAGQWTL